MKKQILTAFLGLAALGANAQTAVTDTVVLGAGYANQVWYSLTNDEQGTAAKDNWDLAFDIVDITASIHINSVSGVMLWNYPKGNKSAWSTVDTSGLSTWAARYNTDTSWAVGAMGRYGDPSNPFDLDWGQYDMSTHKVAGDSIYIIQLVNGDYKKLIIESLSSGVFSFKYANLDGSNETTSTLTKSNFANKNMAYFSLVNDAEVNREPDMTKWDLVFTQYTAFISMGGPVTPYPVSGVLQNRGVTAVKVDNLPNKATYNNWQGHTFSSEINTIGYDWKTFNMSTNSYDIQDSTVYFVAAPDAETGDIAVWKMIFTGFESADGKYIFSKTQLKAASVQDVFGNNTTVAISPNPAQGGNVNVVYDLNSNQDAVILNVTDMTGKTVFSTQLESNAGLHVYALPVYSLSSGMYIVSVNTRGGSVQQKLMVN